MASIRIIKSNNTPNEIQDSLLLMKETFGNVDVSYREYYEWQYLKNPFGTGTVLIAYDGDSPVGQIASIPCVYRINGRLVRISLILNLAVSPKYRGRGIMLRLLDDIRKIEPHGPFSLAVPNKNSTRGFLKKGFKPLKTSLFIRPIRPSKYFHRSKRSILKPFDRIWKKTEKNLVRELSLPFDEQFEELSTGIYKDETIRQVRSAAFLNWRYRSNPRRNYTTLMLTNHYEGLEGYVILTTTELMNREIGIILDIVVKDRKAADSLISKALQYFWEKEVALVLYSCSVNDHESSFLCRYRFLKLPNRFHPHPSTLCLKILDVTNEYNVELYDPQKWIFRFGDYDIF
jgi:hypothetical protein